MLYKYVFLIYYSHHPPIRRILHCPSSSSSSSSSASQQMGILPCPLPCHSQQDSDLSPSNHHLHSESSTSSLSSQSSLPSVPSLCTTQSQTHDQHSAANHHCAATQPTLQGHSSYVSSLAIAGKFLYTGSSDEQIRVWSRYPSPLQNSSDSAVASVAAAGRGAVKSLAVMGDKLFTAHQDHKIRVWKIDNDSDRQKFKCTATLPTLGDRVGRLFSAKNYVEVRRHKKCTWVHHVDAVSALALSKDGSLLYSASWDRTFKIWRTSDFRCLESVPAAHDDAINALTLSGDGFVYTGSADKTIKVWKKREGETKHSLVATLEKHRSAVNALALSADGCVLYSGACDRSIVVWERDGRGSGGGHMAVAGALRGHTRAILCLAVVGDLVCSGSADNTVRVWRRGSGRSYGCVAVLEGHRGPVKSLGAAVDHSTSNDRNASSNCVVYSGSLDCDVKVWKISVPLL